MPETPSVKQSKPKLYNGPIIVSDDWSVEPVRRFASLDEFVMTLDGEYGDDASARAPYPRSEILAGLKKRGRIRLTNADGIYGWTIFTERHAAAVLNESFRGTQFGDIAIKMPPTHTTT